MKIDDIARQSLLYDFYGAMLTERQRGVMELYHEENLSLAEIAGELEISRQGVHDALQKAEKALAGYEEKLGLVARFGRMTESIGRIDARIDELEEQLGDRADAIGKLKEIREIIDKLEEQSYGI